VTPAGQAGGGARVLFLSGLQIHPTQSGGNLRSFELANALRQHGLEVFVYSLVGRKADYLARRRSATQVWPEGTPEFVDRGPLGFVAQYGSYALSLPPVWLTAYLRLAATPLGALLLPRRLRERLAWCDVVVADFPFVSPVFSLPAARGRLRVQSTHNVEHHLFGGPGRNRPTWLRRLMRGIELRAASACDVLVACSDSDQRFFEENAAVRQSVMVPNGIDPRRFEGIGAHRSRVRGELGIGDDERVFLFSGSKWGPNSEAFDRLAGFAASNAALLRERRIHLLVVGSVTATPFRMPGFTATGKVPVVEPFFAAADAALNPMWSGAGTNVKMCEFIALRLPVATTALGARGFRLTDGETGFLFDEKSFPEVLSKMRRLFDEDPERLRGVAEAAYRANRDLIDMTECVRPLVSALDAGLRRLRPERATGPGYLADPASARPS
jgi:glycosyltransferase involved in cell wall biosynthesis